MDISHLGIGALFVVFIGGVLSFFSPCVAPLVPGYISFLSGAALDEDTREDDGGWGAGDTASTPVAAPAAGRLPAGGLRANATSITVTLPRSVVSGHAHSLAERRRAAGIVPSRGVRVYGDVAVSSGAARGSVRGITLGRMRGRVHLDGVMRTSLLFVLGFSLTFILMGLLVGSFGTLLAAYQPVMQTVAGIVMVAMGAFLLNLLPRGWTDFLLRDGRFALTPRSLRSWGAAGPVAFGVVFAAGWSPCIGPVLGAVLAYAGSSGSVLTSVILLTVYSLGFAVPFLAVGLGWSAGLRALGWIKRYGHAVSMVSGVVLILVGLVYLSGKVSIFATWAGGMKLPW